MAWHGYILIESVPPGWLTPQRRSQAWNALHSIGRQNDSQPAHNNHLRERLDQRALIVEALFDDAEITREGIVALIAEAIGLPEAAVDARIDYTIFAEGLSWEESRQACIAYLAANRDDWEEEV